MPVGDNGGRSARRSPRRSGDEHARDRRGRPRRQPHRAQRGASSIARRARSRSRSTRRLPRDAEGRLLDAGRRDRRRRQPRTPSRGRAAAGARRATARRRSRRWSATAAAFRFTRAGVAARASAYRLEVVGAGRRGRGRARTFVARQDATPPEIVLDAPPPAATAHVLARRRRQRRGRGRGHRQRRAGRGSPTAASTRRRRWRRGRTRIEIVATDAVGNVAVKRVETVYDVDPPEIVSARRARPEGAAGPIEIVVEARDGSGLRQAAPYILTIGGVERRGFLRCDERGRHLPRDAAAGAGRAEARRGRGRGLRGQRGEAAASGSGRRMGVPIDCELLAGWRCCSRGGQRRPGRSRRR